MLGSFSAGLSEVQAAASSRPTSVVVHLVPVAVDHVHLQEVEESARGEEAVRQGEVSDVAHVQGEGVGRRRDSAQAHQLADNVPNANT